MVALASAGALVAVIALVVTLVESVRRRNVSAIVNTAVALLIALLPSILPLVLAGVPDFGPAVTLWLATAGFLHALGMLGLYESVWWWDHLTHTVSAALVAALVYAGLTVAIGQSTVVERSFPVLAALTVSFTFAVGVFWELVELVARDVGERFDVEPMLIHYGWRDTALDLAFDVVGALLVVWLELGLFVPIADEFPSTTSHLVLGSGGVIVGGSLLMAIAVSRGRGE